MVQIVDATVLREAEQDRRAERQAAHDEQRITVWPDRSQLVTAIDQPDHVVERQRHGDASEAPRDRLDPSRSG